jgi:hypothetical protein
MEDDESIPREGETEQRLRRGGGNDNDGDQDGKVGRKGGGDAIQSGLGDDEHGRRREIGAMQREGAGGGNNDPLEVLELQAARVRAPPPGNNVHISILKNIYRDTDLKSTYISSGGTHSTAVQ